MGNDMYNEEQLAYAKSIASPDLDAARRLAGDISAARKHLLGALDAERGCRVGCIHLEEVLRTADRLLILLDRADALAPDPQKTSQSQDYTMLMV